MISVTSQVMAVYVGSKKARRFAVIEGNDKIRQNASL